MVSVYYCDYDDYDKLTVGEMSKRSQLHMEKIDFEIVDNKRIIYFKVWKTGENSKSAICNRFWFLNKDNVKSLVCPGHNYEEIYSIINNNYNQSCI